MIELTGRKYAAPWTWWDHQIRRVREDRRNIWDVGFCYDHAIAGDKADAEIMLAGRLYVENPSERPSNLRTGSPNE